jgi:hypothetical protein
VLGRRVGPHRSGSRRLPRASSFFFLLIEVA